jgi:hypothetical protein
MMSTQKSGPSLVSNYARPVVPVVDVETASRRDQGPEPPEGVEL